MERMLLGFVALVIVCVAPNVADATARTMRQPQSNTSDHQHEIPMYWRNWHLAAK
jgi:hypothetical protein